MSKHDHLKHKGLAKIAGKKGVEKQKAFLDNLVEDCKALRASAESKTKEEILAEADELIAQMEANAQEFADELAK